MGLGRSEIIEILERYGLAPSRALGQNFLCDPNVAAKIVRIADISDSDSVVEIGPGVGSLTVELAAAARQIVAVELDRYLFAALTEVLSQRGIDNFELVLADALKADYRKILSAAPFWKLVANLPYNIATPLVLSILEQHMMVVEMLVMVQHEVGERMCAVPGTSAFSQVALKLGYFATAKVVSVVSREVFIPRPNVDSVLVHITRRPTEQLDLDEQTYKQLFSLAKIAFSNRRQMIRRTLSTILSAEEIQSVGIDPSRRPETLELKEWRLLAEASMTTKG